MFLLLLLSVGRRVAVYSVFLFRDFFDQTLSRERERGEREKDGDKGEEASVFR